MSGNVTDHDRTHRLSATGWPERIGHFEILGLLGRGGMGVGCCVPCALAVCACRVPRIIDRSRRVGASSAVCREMPDVFVLFCRCSGVSLERKFERASWTVWFVRLVALGGEQHGIVDDFWAGGDRPVA